jgi:hypothetical protein
MRIYWTPYSIPEFSNLPAIERRKAWRQAYWRAFRRWPIWAALLIPIALGIFVAGPLLADHLGSLVAGKIMGAGIGGGVFGLLANAIVAQEIRRGAAAS